MLILAFFSGLTLFSQTNQTFSTSGTFTVPAGVTTIKVECWGAGGGGSSVTTQNLGGGGGGGGAYAASEIPVTPGSSYTITVGSGGAANSSGGNSVFGSSLVVAAGGAGGTINTSTSGSGGLASASTGAICFSGATGGTGSTTSSGYGGGAAGSKGACAGRTGISNNGGSGGIAVTGTKAGLAGSLYGGGGSGAVTNSTTAASGNTGGAGANGLVVISWATENCAYADNTNSGVSYTAFTNYTTTTAQTISTALSSHQYFLLNVIKGLTYNIYTTGANLVPLKMAVYQEGNAAAGVIASSFSNAGNTVDANPGNVYLSFTSPFSGQARVLLNALTDCSLTTVTGIKAYLTQTGGSNTLDDSTAVGTNSWIGHVYDGVPFSNYIGYYPQTETFREQFGSSGTWPSPGSDDVTNFSVYSGGSVRGSVKTTTFTVRYRMHSTRKGLYTASMTSDDGQRLFVDGNLVYNNWSDHGPSVRRNVLFPLTGSSSLILDYYEKTGQNVNGFDTLQLVVANTLTANTTQAICLGNTGAEISGDVIGTLPTGISLSGTGYQWAYSTTPGGTLTTISGATAATFTPNTSTAPFNTAGTYYLYRTISLVSTNNVSPTSYTGSILSDAATITVNPILTASVSIVASDNQFCNTATATTFTATAVNGGSNPVYEWFVNGIAAGTNSPTYTYTPANNDMVSCIMTSNATPCLQGSPATSNTIQMLIISSSTPASVSISTPSTTICAGNTATFTATPVNGGLTPAYLWFKNGVSTAATGSTYTYTPANNDVISCIMTSSVSGCISGSPATSNSITLTVNTANTITLSSAAGTNAQSVCRNAAITTISYATTGATGATLTGLPAGVSGSWASNKVTISGTPSVAGNYTYTISLTGGYSCSTSTTGTITVYALPSAPTTTGAAVSCLGGTATLTAHGAISGEKYKWYTAATGGTLNKTSTSNTDSTYAPAGLTTNTTYYVSILNANGCEGSRTAVTATFSLSTSADNQNAAGTDSWIGHMYDGTALTGYYGHFTETEAFDEQFSGATTCFSVTSGSETRSIYTESFSTRFRMNSTRKGLYAVTLGSDDGSRLYVDGNLVYNNWALQSYAVKSNVLINLTGTSSLVYEYYENTGVNRVTFNTITKLIENTLTTNTTQNICIGYAGSEISGDVFGTLPTGITLNGTGYQWYYSTTPGGTVTAIPGATGATFTPTATTAPFNTAGTYYLYRYVSLTSVNNVSPTSYSPSGISNYATIQTSNCVNYWTGSMDTNWGNTSNWRLGTIPASGDNIEYATVANYGTSAQNNLQLDQDRTIGNLTNMTSRSLIIPAGKALHVTGTITTDNDPSRIYISAEAGVANGSLIFAGSAPYATVEMYSKATYDLSQPDGSKYNWQYFGIPVESVVASPTFDGAYVRSWYEPGTSSSNHWIQLQNSSVLTPFTGYEISQQTARKYLFAGKLVKNDYSSGQLSYTYSGSGNASNALYPGQHVLSNPYTAAIDITQISFGDQTENTIYLYNTGTFANWLGGSSDESTATGATTTGVSPGQYTPASKNTAGSNGIPGTIPSMQGFLVKAMSNSATATLGISYSSVITKNTELQRSKKVADQRICTSLTLTGEQQSDKVWMFTAPGCTAGFDNGWDATIAESTATGSRIFVRGADADYQINASFTMNNTPLAFLCKSDGTYKLTFTHENTDSTYKAIFLYDAVCNSMNDITPSGSTYSFNATKTATANERFRILTMNNSAPDKGDDTQPILFSAGKTIFVQNYGKEEGSISIYTANGSFAGKYHYAASTTTAIPAHIPTGVYLIRSTSKNSEKIQRLIIQ